MDSLTVLMRICFRASGSWPRRVAQSRRRKGAKLSREIAASREFAFETSLGEMQKVLPITFLDLQPRSPFIWPWHNSFYLSPFYTRKLRRRQAQLEYDTAQESSLYGGRSMHCCVKQVTVCGESCILETREEQETQGSCQV